MKATATRTRPLTIVHTTGDADTATWGIAQVGSRFRVVNRMSPRYAYHTVSLPWPTLEAAKTDLVARLRMQ